MTKYNVIYKAGYADYNSEFGLSLEQACIACIELNEIHGYNYIIVQAN